MTKRTDAWWARVLGDAEDVEVNEPWAALSPVAPALTDEQRAVLAGLEDQPPVPRIRTGSAPGDSDAAHPYRRKGWTEEEHR